MAARLLAHIRSRLAPGGRIALLCEPVGHVFRNHMAAEYLAELLKGVNEQSFTLDEYAMIFEESAFDIPEAVLQEGSLKVLRSPDT